MNQTHDEQMRAIELEKARIELAAIKDRAAFKKKSIKLLMFGAAALSSIWLVLAVYSNAVSPAIDKYKRGKEDASRARAYEGSQVRMRAKR